MFNPYIPGPAGVQAMPDMTAYGGRPGGFPGLMMALARLQTMTGGMGGAPMAGSVPMAGQVPMGGMAMPMAGGPAMPMGGVCPCCGRPMGGDGGIAFSFDGGPGFSVTTEG